MKTVAEKINSAHDLFKTQFGLKNKMQSPKVTKIVVSVGIGSVKDKKKIEVIADRLAKTNSGTGIGKGNNRFMLL